MKSYCSTCSHPTNQEVLHESVDEYDNHDIAWWSFTKYQIIRCKGCDTVSFRILNNDATMQMFNQEDSSMQTLFPSRGAHSRPVKRFKNVPNQIAKVYSETINAYNAALPLLTSVGIRAVLEGICLDKQIKNGNVPQGTGGFRSSKGLDGKIYGLAFGGYLTSDNADVLHELRFLGNAAVHDLTAPALDDLKIAIDIVELILDNIYELKPKALSLKNKRTGSNAS